MAPTSPAVELSDAYFTYQDTSAPVVRGVNLSLPHAGRLLLVGANGAGKSTLLRLIAGRRKSTGGRVNALGQPAFETTELASQVTLITDEWDESLCTLSPAELIASHVARQVDEAGPEGEQQARERAQELLGVLGINGPLLASRTLAACSSGQRRRVQLFLALLPARPLIVLDEATNALDVAARAALLQFLRAESEERGAAVIYCTHIFDGLDGWPTHAAHLKDGSITHTAKADVLSSPGATYALALKWVEPVKTAHMERAVNWLLELHAYAVREKEHNAPCDGGAPSFASPPPMPAWAPIPSQLVATPPTSSPVSAEQSPADKVALPIGWSSRTVASSGAFGDHVWDYDEPPEVRGAKIARLNAMDEDVTSSRQPPETVHGSARNASAQATGAKPPAEVCDNTDHMPAAPEDKCVSTLYSHTSNGSTQASSPNMDCKAESLPPNSAQHCRASGVEVNPTDQTCASSPHYKATPMQKTMAPVLQDALAKMQAHLAACSSAVGSFNIGVVTKEAAELRILWERASAALAVFADPGANGNGAVGVHKTLEPRPMPLPSSTLVVDKHAPRPMTGTTASAAATAGVRTVSHLSARASVLPLGWESRQVSTSEDELIRRGVVVPVAEPPHGGSSR